MLQDFFHQRYGSLNNAYCLGTCHTSVQKSAFSIRSFRSVGLYMNRDLFPYIDILDTILHIDRVTWFSKYAMDDVSVRIRAGVSDWKSERVMFLSCAPRQQNLLSLTCQGVLTAIKAAIIQLGMGGTFISWIFQVWLLWSSNQITLLCRR